MTGIAARAALVCLSGAAVLAQPPQQPQPPIFRGGASLVRVDVTVSDRHGEPVTTLAADDFEVYEDGVAQTVETFKLVSADGRQTEGDDTALDIRSPEHAAAEAARDDIRVFLIFWDEYHIERFVPAITGRKALTEFVNTAFGPTDLVALMDPLVPTDAIRWTRNRGDLAAAIQKLEGRYRVYTPVRSVLEEAQLGRSDVERLRTEVTVSALKSAASYLGGLREGRKAIVFVSEGLPGIHRPEEISLLDDLVRTANDNNTAIYTVDPKGLVGYAADELRIIADNTGAQAFVNTNTPARALRQVVKDATAFYLLGYASTKNPVDGKFHEIKVRVKRSGLEVRARKGYWAPSATDMERAAREAAAGPPTEVSTALASLNAQRPDRVFDLTIETARGANGAAEVTLNWTPRAAAAQAKAVAKGTLSVVADDANGSRELAAPLDARRLSLPAVPGTLRLHVTARDADGETIGDETRAIEVPDPAHVRLAISSPTVVLVRNVAELRSLTADTRPVAGREFTRTDRLFIRFAVYGDAAAGAVISSRLLSRTGAALLTLSVTKPADPTGAYQVDFPLASIARGDYLIAVSAETETDRAEALVPIRVVS